jgi:HNH endonuclease
MNEMRSGRLLATADSLIEEFLSDENYRVEDNGRIYTKLSDNGAVVTNSWRQKYINKSNGYEKISYKNKSLSVHRIVFRKYVGSLSEDLTINHKDGNPLNNHFENLELVPQGQNNLHSYRVVGKKPVYGNTVINFDIADEIRAKKKLGITHKILCKEYGLSKGHISEIVNNKIWTR